MRSLSAKSLKAAPFFAIVALNLLAIAPVAATDYLIYVATRTLQR